MQERSSLLEEIERTREELHTAAHVGSERLRQQWDELDAKWNDFAGKARLQESSEGVEEAVKLLGSELVKGYERIKAAIAEEKVALKPVGNALHAKIERVAYGLWERRGRPAGSPEVDWSEAEKQVLDEERAEGATAA